MALLFGNSASRNQSKNLIEFKAGKMTLKGNMVNPDKRKGLVYVHQTEDSLMHFCWKDRTSGTVEDDFIIFPEDVEFKRVAACTTGRVFVMKFKSNNKKCFFWMQEPKTEKDEEYCSKVNDYLNNPPTPGSGRSGGSTPGGSSADHPGEGDLQNLFSAMNQQQFMQLLGGMGGVGGMANLSNLLSSHGLGSQFGERSSRNSSSTTTSTTTATTTVTSSTVSFPSTAVTTTAAASTPTPTPTVTSVPALSPTTTSTAPIQLSDFQNILSGITARSSTQEAAPQAVDLSRALTAEVLQPILSNAEFMQRIQELLPNTGDNTESSTDHLRSTVQSPQFQQAFSAFSAALHSGQLGPLIHQFGLSEEVAAAAAQGDLDAFVTALQASQKKESEEKKSDKNDDNDEMALD